MIDKSKIKDIYTLSPLQEGILFHCLYDPGSGVYINQYVMPLGGDTDFDSLERAWQMVVNRHPVLRTSFHWEEMERPHQVVYRSAGLRMEKLDWSDISPRDREGKLEEFLKRDRRRGFDLSSVPLMRLILIKMGRDDYRLVWDSHHIVIDAWSGSLIWREVLSYYRSFITGEEISLEKPRPYRDYIMWLRERDLSRAEQYWREELKGFTQPNILEGESPSSGMDEQKGEEGYGDQSINLSSHLTRRLKEFARRNRLTLNTLIQGAWAVLLSRYSGQEDVVYGSTTSGRPAELEGVDSMVGLFINTLPVRIRVEGDREVVSWLRELQGKLTRVREYEYSPLIKVMEWSEVPSGQQLFQTIVVFENVPSGGEDSGGEGGISSGRSRFLFSTNYPVTLVINPMSVMGLRVVYDHNLFGDSLMEGLLEHLEVLLGGVAEDEGRRLRDLDIMGDEERERILYRWNDTGCEYGGSESLAGMFREAAGRYGEREAVVCGDESISYSELDERSDCLAGYLRGLGVGFEDQVGVYMHRGLDMMVSVLGILKGGGAYVPLDREYPVERLSYMVECSGIEVVLVSGGGGGLIPGIRETDVLGDWDEISVCRDSCPGDGVSGDSVGYVLYTSGSTGRPKGVLMPVGSLVNLIRWQVDEFGDEGAGRRVLQFASLSFDVSFQEMFSTWVSGGVVDVVSSEVKKDPERLWGHIAERGIERVFLPFVALQQLAGVSGGGMRGSELKEVITAGEQLRVTESVREMFRGSGCRLINQYGPTETHVVTAEWLGDDVDSWEVLPSIGAPVSNVRLYLLDGDLEPVPVGVEGELYVGGSAVSRGYGGEGGRTAESYLPDRYGGGGGRLYATGDIGRYRPDGRIDFIGRRDDQVKVRGYRVELGEVESVLCGYEGVRDAVVVSREYEGTGVGLTGYLIMDGDIEVDGLRDYLGDRLPGYMIPAEFIRVDEFPLTPSGKVDRSGLPEPEGRRISRGGEYVAPETEVEEALASVWSEILGLDRVGVEDNFFELGGHSLLATRVVSRVREMFQIELPLRTLFEKPELKNLAGEIEKIVEGGESKSAPEIKPLAREKRIIDELDEITDEKAGKRLNQEDRTNE